MTRYCVLAADDVPELHRDDYDTGFTQSYAWAKRVEPDEVDDEAHMARERIASGETSDTTFWFMHGVLAAIASATGRCPHCQRTTGPCTAAGKVA